MRDDLCCAVSELEAVPPFVTSRCWTFVGRVTEGSSPRGFETASAEAAMSLLGFYLFQEAR